MNRHLWFAATLALPVVATSPALAQEVNDGWRVSVTPYLWVSAYEGDVTDRGSGATVESDASFGDLLENLSFVFIGKGEVQYKRVGAFGDLIYLKLKADQTIQRPILGTIETEASVATTAATAAAFYRVVESDQTSVDLLAGVRFVKLKLDLDFQGAGPGLSREASKSFTEPVIGVRATQRIGPRSSFTAYGDLGAFGGSTDVWQVLGTFNYQFSNKLTGSVGYRYFSIDVDKPLFEADVSLKGPLLGLTYVF